MASYPNKDTTHPKKLKEAIVAYSESMHYDEATPVLSKKYRY